MHLKKLGIDYDLVIYDENAKDLEDVRKEVFKGYRNEGFNKSIIGVYTCNHYCLRVKDFGIINDYDGDLREKHKYIIPNVPYKRIKWIYKEGDWNDIYNNQNNNTIKQIFKMFFKRYEKDNTF